MALTITCFGKLQECFPDGIHFSSIPPTIELLRKTLIAHHPALAQENFLIAVNKKIALPNDPIQDGDIVVLLPPFSGG